MTANRNLLERSLASVWHPCTQMKHHEALPLIPISHGLGTWLYDFEGNRYLDAISSWWVNLFGHANPRINAALRDQMEKLEHVILAGFTHEPVVELSERLIQLAPNGLGHCFYASDGTSAIEIALKMSFHYWKNIGKPEKTEFMSLQNGYHGETIGALSVTDVAIFKNTYAPLLKPSAQMPSPDSRFVSWSEDASSYAKRCSDALESYLKEHAHQTAAFVIEPLIQCAAGMGMYPTEYLEFAREICSRYRVHLIADEIAVGFGRTGSMFACEQAGISPDFLCLSKGISGGYLPLSVVLTQQNIYEVFYDDDTARGFLHSHSYSGNALACRAALATLDIFKENTVLETNRIKAAYLTNRAKDLSQHPRVKNFRNTGMVWAFEVETTQPGFAQHVFQEGLKRELLLRPIGNTVYLMPPYIISHEEIDFLVDRTTDIVSHLKE